MFRTGPRRFSDTASGERAPLLGQADQPLAYFPIQAAFRELAVGAPLARRNASQQFQGLVDVHHRVNLETLNTEKLC